MSQLESATRAAIALRDSLASLQHFAGSLLTSTRELIDKVSSLESKEYLTSSRQSTLEQSIVLLQSENKQLTQQVADLQTRLLVSSPALEPSVFSPARSTDTLKNEYAEGVKLFRQRQFDEASAVFKGLLEKGIEEDLADNCEYWIGECHYARREFQESVYAFQKVLAIPSSNKKVDAYLMLGKSYEQLGDPVKARWAYGELNSQYPNNVHSRTAYARVEALKRFLPLPRYSKQKKSTA